MGSILISTVSALEQMWGREKGTSGFHFTLLLYFICLFVCLFFQDRVSLYSPGCPGNHSVDQAGLELRDPPASVS